MGKRIDITGKKFNKLTVIGYVGNNKSGAVLWECVCDCGKLKIGTSQELRVGSLKSCGCSTSFDRSEGNRKHGWKAWGKTPPEYAAWGNMIQRCTNPNRVQYSDYGGRGIKVCERWLVFENFINDVGRRPTKNHSIDRFPNNDGHYELSNFRWATKEQQNRNKRNTKLIEHNGEKMIIRDWAKKYLVCEKRLADQLKKKSFEDAIAFLLNPNRNIGRGSAKIRKVGIYLNGKLIKKYDKMTDVVNDGYNFGNVRYYLKCPAVRNGVEWKYLDNKKTA